MLSQRKAVKTLDSVLLNALSDDQRRLIEAHLKGVLDINTVHNLTRITSWEEGMLLHVEDSLVGLKELEEAPEGPCADLGTGGGFPGVPLSIVSGRNILLVDSVQKKMTAVQTLIDELGLSDQIQTYAGRIEDLSKERPQSFSVLTARALSSLPSLLELASPLLVQGGRLICYKSQLPGNELEHAQALEGKLAMHFISERQTTLSDGFTHRTIVVFEKQGEPTIKLPRKVGSAQKNPYSA